LTVSATGNDFKISGDVTGVRGFDFAVVAEFSMWDRSLVWINDLSHRLLAVADEDEGCPVVGVGEVLGAFFVGFVEADSGAIGGIFEREFAVD
jgi:hypothetical protein